MRAIPAPIESGSDKKTPQPIQAIEKVVSEFVEKMQAAQRKEAALRKSDPENKAWRMESVMSREHTQAVIDLSVATAEQLLNFPIPDAFAKKIADRKVFSNYRHKLTFINDFKMEDLDKIFDEFDIPTEFVDRLFYLMLRIEEEYRRAGDDKLHDIIPKDGDPVFATGNRFPNELDTFHRVLLAAYLNYISNSEGEMSNEKARGVGQLYLREVRDSIDSTLGAVRFKILGEQHEAPADHVRKALREPLN